MPNRRIRRNVDPSMIPGFMRESRYASLGSRAPNVPALGKPAAPKHFPSPSLSYDSDFCFEAFMLFFTAVCTGLQFINLYHTVWWTTNSHTNQALHFYLIDKSLVAFIIILLSRRLIYLIGNRILDFLVPSTYQNEANLIFRVLLVIVLFFILGICTFYMVQNNLYMNIFYLCYPISVYFVLFGFKIKPFFEMVDWDMDNLTPLHACTKIARDIRQEVEKLKSNFNSRMKQILFNSVLDAYYAGFIPCCFAQYYVHFNVYWATQHTVFIFLSSFVAFCCHILHPRYCDILHRSALHLGTWDKMETRNMLLVNNKWNEETLWPYGALVRYGRDVYRAQGECNSSEPGNTSHSKFYALFNNPSTLLKYLLTLQAIVISWQLFLHFTHTYWHDFISIFFLLFFNIYFMYKIVRDYKVSSYIYKEEKVVHVKARTR